MSLMAYHKPLPKPLFALQKEAGLSFLTDNALFEACGVRVAFSARAGGVSKGAYASLNVGAHVGDEYAAVQENRARLVRACGAKDMACIVPRQVHGTNLVFVEDKKDLTCVQSKASEGADGLIVSAKGVCALMCFADCLPLIIVSPSGRFAVAHAGWRGALAHIAKKAVLALAQVDEGCATGDYNAYIGPHIRSECFECGSDVCGAFVDAFGAGVSPARDHVSLAFAVESDLVAAGLSCERISDVGVCTKCQHDEWFSYRASGGECGRHAALCFCDR